jgi:Raf kinase inhibitor-like YbhB/YbcL family protein
MKRKRLPWSVVTGMLLALCVCGPGGCKRAEDKPDKVEPVGPPSEGTLSIRSKAFEPGKAIPPRHTGDGEDVSPPLTWSGVPPAAKELALIMDDPDAPRPKPWVHWVIYKIPADAAGLPQAVPKQAELSQPAGAVQGKNTWGRIGYGGPAPPKGRAHHYHFKLYALDAALSVKPGLDKPALLAAMSGHILARGELIATYQR